MSHRRDEPLWPKFMAGGLSCMTISAILNPMDVIKVRLQLQNQMHRVSIGHIHGIGSPYHGFFHAASKILHEEGFFGGLMKGITPSMIRELSYSSIRMGLYDPIKQLLQPGATSKDDFTLIQKILAGALSGAIGSSLLNPTDLVKIRFQSVLPGQSRVYKHTADAFYKIYNFEGGIRGLYKGMIPTTMRASVLTSAQLSSYDHTKRVLLRNGLMEDNVYLHLVASIISGLVTTTATNPFDIVKTRWMASLEKNLYKSPLDCFIKTVSNEGFIALLKGWVPNYLRLGPHFLLSLPLNEFIRRMLGAGSV